MPNPAVADPAPRFRFVLTPLDQVVPWGGEEPRLHWFGLTDGWYWIDLGNHELLRYSPQTLHRHRAGGGTTEQPYVDYYVARLWEDLLGLGAILRHRVPDDLVEFVAGSSSIWQSLDDDDATVDAALTWYSDHILDLGYLRRAPRIRAWRTSDEQRDLVTMTWRHQPSDDIQFTAPTTGQVTVAADAFLAAIRHFDSELLTAMDDRIRALEQAGPPAGIHLDLDHLRREHDDRATWLERRLAHDPDPAPEWDTVRAGVRRLHTDPTRR